MTSLKGKTLFVSGGSRGIGLAIALRAGRDGANVALAAMKRFDLMMGINTRGTFMVSKYCIPHLKKADNPHILMLSPPLDMQAKWFEHSTAYTVAKFGMSLCVLGLAAEVKNAGVAVNALWPRTTISTAAVGNLLGGDAMMRSTRKPEIMGDAAYAIFTKPSLEFTGQFCIDDKVLYANGVRDFEPYRVDPSAALMSDFFVPDNDVPPPGVTVAALPSVGGAQKSR